MRKPLRIGAAAIAVAGATALLSQEPQVRIDTSRMTQTFSDDFDGSTLDGRKWTQGDRGDPIHARTMSGNAERQVYLDPRYLDLGIQPVTLRGGTLTITARPLTPPERAVVAANVDVLPPPHNVPALRQLGYSSGRIMTRDRFVQKYGYFEIRARFDPGKGLWPAFWLLRADGGWPPEIDVMEALGHDPGTVYATVHSAGMAKQTVISKPPKTDDGYHRYGVLWGPETIDVYVDGVKTGSAKTPPDAHQPMYMIVNMAVGGNWPGDPDAATRFPATMDVDYVRAWKLPPPQKK